MTTLKIELPPKLIPVFTGSARYRGAYGGRGSAKTRSFAKMAAVRAVMFAKAGVSGIVLCGREFMNSLDESSMAEVKAAIESEPFLKAHFEVGEKYIRTIGDLPGRVDFKFAGLRHNLDSIKSKARILILWVDEAEPVSEAAWIKVVPTVREHGSEIWVTWNSERRASATHKRYRENPPSDSKIVEMNYTDNPWFPDVLEQERLNDLRNRPDDYAHIWEGDFKTSFEGAYFTQQLLKAKSDGRIGKVPADPHIQYRAFWDIGTNDATAIWVCQFVGREIRVLDYYEASGQPLAAHLNWLRSRGYEGCLCVLPHDGASVNHITARKFEDHIKEAGFAVETIANQGKGAAMRRVEAARKLFASCWFNADTTEAGRDALAAYHEKRDENRNIGLGPEHDWSSHSADAFGLMCTAYEPPQEWNGGSFYGSGATTRAGWMGA